MAKIKSLKIMICGPRHDIIRNVSIRGTCRHSGVDTEKGTIKEQRGFRKNITLSIIFQSHPLHKLYIKRN